MYKFDCTWKGSSGMNENQGEEQRPGKIIGDFINRIDQVFHYTMGDFMLK